MLKKALLGLSLLTASYLSSAAIVTQSQVTGADMVGLEVTVDYASGGQETLLWQMISNTPLMTGDPILDMNGYSGGVTGMGFSLIQAGVTLGGYDDSTPANPYGLWTLTNTGQSGDITGFKLSGLAANVAFDILDTAVFTPNSGSGQHFISNVGSTGTYSDQVNAMYDDLFYTLDVTFDTLLGGQESALFFADTEIVGVSEPATLAFVLAGMALFSRRLSRK